MEGVDCKEIRNAAFFFAGALLCESENAPCGYCKSCKKVFDFGGCIHPDVHIFQPEKTKHLSVDTVREVKKTIFLLPNDSKKQIYIFFCAEKMTPGAQNALLKFFEEPPASAVFILCTDSRDSLLPTVISRGRIFTFDNIKSEDMKAFLKSKFPGEKDDIIAGAVDYSGGSVGRAEEFLTQRIQKAHKNAAELCKKIFSGAAAFEVYAFLLPFADKREEASLLLSFTAGICSDMLKYKMTGDISAFIPEAIADEYEEIRVKATSKQIYSAAKFALEAEDSLSKNANGKITLSLFASRVTAKD